MIAFFKKKEDDAEAASQAAMQKELKKEQDDRAVRKARKIESQSSVLAQLKQMLTPEAEQELAGDIAKAEYAIQAGETVPATAMKNISDKLTALEQEKIRKAVAGMVTGGVLCCGAASEARHGLDSLAMVPRVGRALFTGMAA